MPKETIKESVSDSAIVEVRWGPDHFDCVQLGVDRGMAFKFVGKDGEPEEPNFTGLWFYFHSREEVDRLIKALHKAKRKTFNS